MNSSFGAPLPANYAIDPSDAMIASVSRIVVWHSQDSTFTSSLTVNTIAHTWHTKQISHQACSDQFGIFGHYSSAGCALPPDARAS